MTDNGAAFRSRRYAKALRRLAIAHKRTRPFTPKTNGKAERFVPKHDQRRWHRHCVFDSTTLHCQNASRFDKP